MNLSRSMRCYVSLLVAGVLCFVPSAWVRAQVTPGPLSTAEIARRGLPTTVTIFAIDQAGDTISQGSGVVIRSNGIIVTNWHVLEGASGLAITLSTGETFRRALFIEGDSTLDLALLKIAAVNIRAASTNPALPDVGEKLVAIGSPLGLSRTVSEGIVSANRIVGGRRLLQMSTPISPGSSGGPVFNQRGQVVAVATSYLEGGQQLNFAVPISYALGLIELGSTPRELASIFAASPTARSQPSDRAVPMRAARYIRPTLNGSYVISEVSAVTPPNRPPYTVRFTGQLFLAPKDGGIGMQRVEGEPEDSTALSFVVAHSTAPDGRVGLRWSGSDYSGYQTDEGFFAEADFSLNNGSRVRSRLVARAVSTPLTEPTGIYAVEVRTRYTRGSYTSSNPIDWAGVAVIGVAAGRIIVDMRLENSDGGTISLFNSAPIKGEQFSVPSKDGSRRLEGRVSGGRVYAKWTDSRDNGARFEGDLLGRRQ